METPGASSARPPPRAVLRQVQVEDGRLLLRGDVAGLPADRGPAEADAEVEAVARTTRTSARTSAAISGSTFSAALPLADVAQPGRWDLALHLHRSGQAPLVLRLGLAAPSALPRTRLQSVEGPLRVRAYRTGRGNLSLRVRQIGPRAPRPRFAPRPAPPWLRRLAEAYFRTVEQRTRRGRRTASPLQNVARPRVTFVIRDAYGMGGTIRTTFTVAGALAAAGHRVRVVSLLQSGERPFLPVPHGVRLTPLFDERARGRRAPAHRSLRGRVRGAALTWLDGWQSVLTSPRDKIFRRSSLATDLLLVRALQRLRPGVVVLTRPALNVAGARFAAPGVRTLGQEHTNFTRRSQGYVDWLRPYYARLDALALLTEGDVADWGRALGEEARLVLMPNGLPSLPRQRAEPSSRVVVAAGRLTRQKGFDLLLPAFAQAAGAHPDWQLRIYGDGPQRRRLGRQIAQLGLGGRAHLMGRTSRMYDEMARGSVFALSSRFEGFGMVLIEAMGVGLAVVAFDCPRGPADIVQPGQNGLLVPPQDVDALAAALSEVMSDDAHRERLAAGARRRVEQYCFDRGLGERWRELLSDLTLDRPAVGGDRPAARP